MAEDKNSGAPTESDADLIAHLERLSGRSIKSRKDIAEYVDDLTRKGNQRKSKSQHLKNLLLALLLIVSAAQYYYLDVQLQILAQPSLTVFVPVKDGAAPTRPYI
jgi:hypothetical protein